MRTFICLADLSGQETDGCGGIAVRIPRKLASFQQFFAASFGLINSSYHLIAIRGFPAVLVVLGSQFLKEGLHLVAILIPVVVLFVQDQPEFKAWIGTADTNTVLFAKCYRFTEARMIVTVEYRPDLVGFFEGILSASAAWTKPLRQGVLDGFLRYGVGDTNAANDF